MTVKELIARLGTEIGIPELVFNQEGMARLQFDGNAIVDFEYEAETESLHMYSVIDRLPEEHREAVYEQLLVGNLFQRQTRGAVLAISPMEQDILITRTIQAEKYTYSEFTDILEEFIAAAEEWSARLAEDAQKRELADVWPTEREPARPPKQRSKRPKIAFKRDWFPRRFAALQCRDRRGSPLFEYVMDTIGLCIANEPRPTNGRPVSTSQETKSCQLVAVSTWPTSRPTSSFRSRSMRRRISKRSPDICVWRSNHRKSREHEPCRLLNTPREPLTRRAARSLNPKPTWLHCRQIGLANSKAFRILDPPAAV